jgi:hypothetical protein
MSSGTVKIAGSEHTGPPEVRTKVSTEKLEIGAMKFLVRISRICGSGGVLAVR